MSETLSLIVADAQRISNQLIENGGELTPEIEAELDDIDLKMADKIDKYNYVIERFDLEKTYWKNKAELYLKIAKSCDSAKNQVKDRIKGAMMEMKITEVKGFDFRFKLSRSKPKVAVIDEESIPAKYFEEVITYKMLKDDIKLAIERGEDVDGAALDENFSLRVYPNKGVKK